jgi:hypothetical protein
MASRGVREDVVVRALEPAPPPRPIMVAVPAGYRSPSVAAMLAILHEVGEQWVEDRERLRGDYVVAGPSRNTTSTVASTS